MHNILTTPIIEATPEDLLQQALAAGHPIEAAYRAGQVQSVADITLPEHRAAWPLGTSYNVVSTSKDPAISALDAHAPDFFGAEATVYAQEALGINPDLTKARLLDMVADVRMNTPPARIEARRMLDEFD